MRLVDVADIEKFIRENRCAIGDDHLLLVAGNDGRWQFLSYQNIARAKAIEQENKKRLLKVNPKPN
jgi:hypothetical protein